MVSEECDMMAEENCALNEHKTKNMVCCAKHHLEIPCSKCADLEKQAKEAVEKSNKEKITKENSSNKKSIVEER
jgi:hypothetical protein